MGRFNQQSNDEITMPAGTYYIGDLCYVLHDEWDEVCELIIKDHDVLDGKFTLKDGREFVIFSTAYGDGVYTPSTGGECPVDAGSIGCIKIDNINEDNEDNAVTLGVTVEFPNTFSCHNDKGVMQFGHVHIDTIEADEDDDLGDYDDFDEEDDED